MQILFKMDIFVLFILMISRVSDVIDWPGVLEFNFESRLNRTTVVNLLAISNDYDHQQFLQLWKPQLVAVLLMALFELKSWHFFADVLNSELPQRNKERQSLNLYLRPLDDVLFYSCFYDNASTSNFQHSTITKRMASKIY